MSFWERTALYGISLGLLMTGWTGFQSVLIYSAIGLISFITILVRISKKPKTSGVRCWAMCISIVISSILPIFFYSASKFNINSINESKLATIFDLTHYIPYSNLNELIAFNTSSAAKWILGILVFQILFNIYCSRESEVRTIFICSWLIGVAISIGAQLLQLFKLFPTLSLFNYDYLSFNGRYPGLSDHPNTIAIIVTLSTPLLYLSGMARKKLRFIIIYFMISELLSQSRIGIATFAFALLLCNWQSLRRRLLHLLVLLVGIVILWLVYKLGAFNTFIESSRFNSSNIASQNSNLGHGILTEFGINTFFENPFFGVGPRAFKESHNIYIQVLASLGILGFAGFIDFLVRPLFRKYEGARETFLAKVCILTFMIFGLFNNKLNDFYLYFPLILSLQILLNAKREQGSVQI